MRIYALLMATFASGGRQARMGRFLGSYPGPAGGRAGVVRCSGAIAAPGAFAASDPFTLSDPDTATIIPHC